RPRGSPGSTSSSTAAAACWADRGPRRRYLVSHVGASGRSIRSLMSEAGPGVDPRPPTSRSSTVPHDPAFDGKLVLPADPDWEDARVGRVFNGRRPDRQPDAVLLAASVADVQRGVRLAKERGWTVAVRSGGHSWAAWSVREGGLLIDLGALREARYDETTGIVTAGPAIKGGDELSPYLEERGRFFNGGHCPSVAIGGGPSPL